MIPCQGDQDAALLGLNVLRTYSRVKLSSLPDSDKILFGNDGAEIRRIDNLLRGQSSRHDRNTISSSDKIRKVYLLHQDYKVGWLLDDCASKCYLCRSIFTMMHRRHHCRACGNIFCSSCCAGHVSVEFFDTRVCNTCFPNFSSKKIWSLGDFLTRVNDFAERESAALHHSTIKLEGIPEEVPAQRSSLIGVSGLVVSPSEYDDAILTSLDQSIEVIAEEPTDAGASPEPVHTLLADIPEPTDAGASPEPVHTLLADIPEEPTGAGASPEPCQSSPADVPEEPGGSSLVMGTAERSNAPDMLTADLAIGDIVVSEVVIQEPSLELHVEADHVPHETAIEDHRISVHIPFIASSPKGLSAQDTPNGNRRVEEGTIQHAEASNCERPQDEDQIINLPSPSMVPGSKQRRRSSLRAMFGFDEPSESTETTEGDDHASKPRRASWKDRLLGRGGSSGEDWGEGSTSHPSAREATTPVSEEKAERRKSWKAIFQKEAEPESSPDEGSSDDEGGRPSRSSASGETVGSSQSFSLGPAEGLGVHGSPGDMPVFPRPSFSREQSGPL